MQSSRDRQHPDQVKAKLARFLQFHDQQTEGIPGLCLLYPGLQMRVTAKIMKNSKVTILKHTPCTVVGWELHSHDKVLVDEKRRTLLDVPTENNLREVRELRLAN